MGTAIDGKSIIVTITPTVDTNIYASGDQIGVANELPNMCDSSGSDTLTIQDVIVLDKAKQKAAFDILFFNDSPTLASADNAALSITDAEMAAKFIGRVSVAAADYKDTASNSDMTRTNIGLLVKGAGAGRRSLWCVLQSQGTPTYTSASDLVIRIGAFQD